MGGGISAKNILENYYLCTQSRYDKPIIDELLPMGSFSEVEQNYGSNHEDLKKIKNVKFIPDGNGEFTEGMGMLNCMRVVGFGPRSRRYAMIVNDGTIEQLFVEPEATMEDPDPYGISSPSSVMAYLVEAKAA